MLNVTHVSDSTLAGSKSTLPTARVRIGRRQECEIRFDAQKDPSVSGMHAEVRVEGGRVLLRDLGSTNGTFVGAARVAGEVVLGPQDVVRLGANGPRLQFALAGATDATLVDASGAAPTAPVGAAGPPERAMHAAERQGVGADPGAKRGVGLETLQRVVVAERSKARRNTLIVSAAVLAILLGVAGFQFLRQQETERTLEEARHEVRKSREAAEEARELAARARDELDRRLETARGEHAAELAALKGEISAGEGKVSSLIVEIDGRNRQLAELTAKAADETAAERALREELEERVRALSGELAAQQAELREQAGKTAPDWAGLSARYQRSIFLCLAQTAPDANGSFSQSIGTAWVCRADGILATNAHVAEFLKDPSQWAAMACVQNDTGVPFAVQEVLLHPKYTGRPDSPDVALIRIDTMGQDLLALPLAEESELRALRIGTQLGTMGYPGELTLQYVRALTDRGELLAAQATFKDGWIGRILDFGGLRAPYESSYVIQHSASLSGGTSGSPMFTRDGRVVGLNNAGHDLMVKVEGQSGGSDRTERMANPAEIGYAVRVDLLQELLRDSGW